MAIITISREIAALGDETASELAKLLDYRFVDKASLEQRFATYGFSERKLEKFDERKPSFWASLSQDRDDYLHYLKTAMYAEAMEGNCVFIGRGAGAIFKDLPGVVSVRLIAPMPIRIERVKSYFRCDDKRARQIIEQSDHDRAGFHKFFFDSDWTSPDNYQLTLNTGFMHPSTAAELIKELRDLCVTTEADAKSRNRIKDMALAQAVVNRVLYEKKIPIHFLEAKVDDGAVVLNGVANSQASVEASVAAAKEVPGVRSVLGEIQVVQEYSVMP
ncbi:MAG TPA: phospholipid-binding protein [Treponema sp.]|nr:MAG: phospholipid-binding protein [Treponema sp. GWA1_62_8]OHE64469.1 MAG: phospholipid-binding protein [Treponema sp. GWC1_61_84]OHE75500.1 MAG: phospholipid-binding protein [Treponema sp. RIFOXYC1_FULL_61_9]HCM26694.1 phospholipid-binding protein [Treponema sp.]